MRIIITGSSGFIGKALVARLQAAGHEIIQLVRKNPHPEKNSFFWNPEKGDIDPQALEGADAIINLAGENIFHKRWSSQRKKEILESRLKAASTLIGAWQRAQNPPRIWIQASAVGFYGNSPNQLRNELSPKGQGFLADVCEQWEKTLEPIANQNLRIATLRFGVVLGPHGGMLEKLIPMFTKGLGAKLGSGEQWMSWVALEDLLSIMEFALANDSVHGVFNASSPEPVTNAEFTETLSELLSRKTYFSLPAWVLHLIFGREKANELLLSSVRVEPKELKRLGYLFHYPNLKQALQGTGN